MSNNDNKKKKEKNNDRNNNINNKIIINYQFTFGKKYKNLIWRHKSKSLKQTSERSPWRTHKEARGASIIYKIFFFFLFIDRNWTWIFFLK